MSNTQPTRRSPVKLPSRAKHAVLAVSLLALGYMIPFAVVAVFGNPQLASAEGRVAIAAMPIIEPASALDNEGLKVPDLLAGDVPEGVNPTDALIVTAPKTDALGNPASPSPQPKTINIPPRQNRGLSKAPIAGLTRQSAFGPVPVNGLKSPLSAYKRGYSARSGKKPVSLIIGGLGIDGRATQNAIQKLPADVTLSFAAHAVGLQGWIDKARADGHEVLIEVPMESLEFDPTEPGAKRTLRVSASTHDTTRNLDWMLSRSQGYAGVINFNGDMFLTRADVAAPFVDYMSKTGLGFMTDGDFETPSLPALSRSMGLRFKAGHGLIDPDPIPRVIAARLKGLSSAAASGGHPVGVGFGYSETINEVELWISQLDQQNLQLVPATGALK